MARITHFALALVLRVPSLALGLAFPCPATEAPPRGAHATNGQWVGASPPRTQSETATEAWRRVRSPGSGAGTQTAAILHIADFERSDSRLAGLMLRCGDAGVEAVFIVIEPYPPHAHPKITLRAADHESYFDGDIIPTGAGVRLPVDAGELANGPWHGSKELGVTINDGASTIEGVVGLSGLAPALASLKGECAAK
jgi:hypothetical protein